MQINRKKIITIFLAFLILFALINWQTLRILIFWKQDESMSVWDFLTARPVPSSVTQYPTPGAPHSIPSNLPIISPNHLDPLPWGVRLASKEMPHVEGVIWKIYINKEYGFEMQYPERWKIDSYIDIYGLAKLRVYQIIHFSFTPPDGGYDNLSLTLLRHRNNGLLEYFKRAKEIDGYNYPSITKYIIINNVNWLVNNPDAYDMQSDMYAEKNDYIYEFGGTSFSTRNERNIIEYMIKSFHFVQ